MTVKRYTVGIMFSDKDGLWTNAPKYRLCELTARDVTMVLQGIKAMAYCQGYETHDYIHDCQAVSWKDNAGTWWNAGTI